MTFITKRLENFDPRKLLPDYRNLFFVKRRPKWNMSKDWERPPDAEYQQNLHWDGFITPEYWDDDDITSNPLIAQDLEDLEEYLLPTFWEFNQKSKYYQNNFYKFQWVFTFGAFCTTIFAIATGYYGGLESDTVRFFIIQTSKSFMVDFFGVLTAVVSAITSYYTILSNQNEPRKRWGGYRRLAEELRMTYFRFLSRTEPYNTADRVDELRRHVLEVRRQEQENG